MKSRKDKEMQILSDLGTAKVCADKGHINRQIECLEHTIEVRESLARGYAEWSEINLEISGYCLCAENDIPF